MSGTGSGEGTGERDLCGSRLPAEQSPGDQPDPDGTCRMGTGRADHDRPENIKNVHGKILSLPNITELREHTKFILRDLVEIFN